ncbi:MGDG synthase family glycosyltransferase [Clostridium akagii]|uniref:MGDG synthase family glycosyltransferase n=1 Tax=Clostridium akagii TaxID=91623 RepID=UPI0006915F88|nr:glycosyltransferase [Clostridium akagii]
MNILIISSNNTGSGHKSIAEALLEQFDKLENVNAKVIEGFNTNGTLGNTVSKSYGFLTRRARVLWKAVWNISLKRPELIIKLTEKTMEKNFIKILDMEKPDLILSIHPNFNGPVLNILYKNGYRVPFVTLIADLISITPLWVDKRADLIICPTEEAKDKCIGFGALESKIKVVKFPVRSRFYNLKHKNDIIISDKFQKNIEFLLMSGGEGVGNLGNIAEILLENFNCKVKIIAGKNTILKNKLENKYSNKYGDRLEIYGYVTTVNRLMQDVDVLITRGSPNVLMEAVASNLPAIITGALLGQEEENSYYIEKNNLGIVCRDYNNIKATVEDLFASDGKLIDDIKKSQREYTDKESTKKTVDFVVRLAIEIGQSEKYSAKLG